MGSENIRNWVKKPKKAHEKPLKIIISNSGYEESYISGISSILITSATGAGIKLEYNLGGSLKKIISGGVTNVTFQIQDVRSF